MKTLEWKMYTVQWGETYRKTHNEAVRNGQAHKLNTGNWRGSFEKALKRLFLVRICVVLNPDQHIETF